MFVFFLTSSPPSSVSRILLLVSPFVCVGQSPVVVYRVRISSSLHVPRRGVPLSGVVIPLPLLTTRGYPVSQSLLGGFISVTTPSNRRKTPRRVRTLRLDLTYGKSYSSLPDKRDPRTFSVHDLLPSRDGPSSDPLSEPEGLRKFHVS